MHQKIHHTKYSVLEDNLSKWVEDIREAEGKLELDEIENRIRVCIKELNESIKRSERIGDASKDELERKVGDYHEKYKSLKIKCKEQERKLKELEDSLRRKEKENRTLKNKNIELAGEIYLLKPKIKKSKKIPKPKENKIQASHSPLIFSKRELDRRSRSS